MGQRRTFRSFESLESRRVFSATASAPNVPPVADAGNDVSVVVGKNVTLNGSHSTDPDSGPSPLTYEWSVIEGHEYRLAYYLGPKPQFMSLKPGQYVLELKVSDGVLQSSDTVTITVIDPPPTEFPTESILALGTVAGSKSRPLVKVVDARTGDVISKFNAYSSNFHGGVHVAVADLDGDGNAEIITAPGAGNSKSLIKVFDVHGVELPQFRTNAFPSSYRGGVFIAAGDVDGDGFTDLIAGPGSGRAGQIQIWLSRYERNHADPFTASANRKFLAFDARFKGGVTVAAGDLDGDGAAEIVVGSGLGMPPSVRGFDLALFGGRSTAQSVPTPLFEIHPGASSIFSTGFSVAVGDFTSDPFAEIAIGTLESGAPTVNVYNYQGQLLRKMSPFGAEQATGPVYVAFKDVDGGDELELLIAGRTKSGTALVTRDLTGVRVDRVLEDDADFRNGAFIG